VQYTQDESAVLEIPEERAMESRDQSLNIQSEGRSPTQIVCIYAMRDEPFYRELQAYLVLWHTKGHIRWLDIPAGVDLEQTLLAFVQQADLILLLISPSFFATRVCHKAMERSLAEQARRSVPVVPLLARASDWKESDCGQMLALPENELPIAEWRHQERAYEQIRAGLARFVPGLSAQSVTHKEPSRIWSVRDLPRGYIPRPKAFEEIKHLLLDHQDNQTTAITTALRGAGGFGKTTLALALCHDTEIQAAFPDGILWVELGEHPPRPLDVLSGVLVVLEPSRPAPITLDEARDRWRRALSQRRCLLVIDDVWQAAALSPLLEGGPLCTRLVTTRNDQVLPEETARFFVDAMEPEEAIAVLCRGLPEEIQQGAYQSALEALAKRLGCWPLLLTLAHGLLLDQVRYGRSIASALAVVEHAYEQRGVTAFHLERASERHQTVEQCLEVSLRHLSEPALARYQAATRYQELAIFPEDTDIPLATLYTFWKGTGGLSPWEVDELCVRLNQLSLLLTCDLGKGTIRLHDVMRSYLIQRAGSSLPALHARFLDVSKQLLGLSRWADLSSEEHYLWQYLILHLCEAVHIEELQATLTDPLYLTRKVLYVGVSALEADLLLASTSELTAATTPARSLFSSLHRTIVQISHLLRQVSTPAEVGGLLLSYLGSQPPLAASTPVFYHELPRPFLTARHPLPIGLSPALRRTLRGHTHWVNGCAVSPDCSFIVSACWDRTLKVWDVATGDERLTLTGHRSQIRNCAVSPDNRFIVSASNDHTLKLWDARTGAQRFTLTGHTGEVRSCAVSPDGRFIVSASKDHTLKLWDAQTGTERLTLKGHTDEIRGCAVSPDGRSIVSASDDHTLKLWDAQTGVERLTLTGHTSLVRSCAVSPDGRFIVSASKDHTLKIWDAQTGVEHLTLTGHTSPVRGCAVSPDGRSIVSASDDHTLKLWDALTGTERFTLTGHTDEVNSCAVSSNGRFIVSASDDHTLKIWDAPTEVLHPTPTGHTNAVRGCAVSPDGHFIVSASDDRTLKLWDAHTGVERLTLTGHTSIVRACAVSPDGRSIISASRDQTLKVWDAATGVERLTLTGHTGGIFGCAVSPDGRFIVSASWDKTLKLWDAHTGLERLTLTGHTNWVFGCTVSPDGRSIISASDDHTLKLWDAHTGLERLTLKGHTNLVSGCAVSPDGTFIVSASHDRKLKVWDAATGAERLTLTGHRRSVRSCTVSPDSRYIVSASNDHTLKLWDAQTGQCMLTFPVDGALFGCAFYPDGEHLVACGAQGMYFLRLVV
jgi:WD40 repeat protein